MVAHRDPLAQLGQPPAVEPLTQLGLADQHDLQQFAPVRLQVGEEPDLFEQLRFEVLGLVDEQDDIVAPLGLLEQEPVERFEAGSPVFSLQP